MAENYAVVGVCDPHPALKNTNKKIQNAGLGQKQKYKAGRDYHTQERDLGHYNAGDRMNLWCQLGHFWGGLSGMLMGSAFYFIPGIGPIIVFGPLVSWIVRALKGAGTAGELSALGTGLHSIGIPVDSIMEYEKALKFDKFIVIAHGTSDEAAKAKSILESGLTEQSFPFLR